MSAQLDYFTLVTVRYLTQHYTVYSLHNFSKIRKPQNLLTSKLAKLLDVMDDSIDTSFRVVLMTLNNEQRMTVNQLRSSLFTINS